MTSRPLVAELVGTALLLVAIVGSGVVVAPDGPPSVQLFLHAAVVALALTALILTFGPVSGAHFNPAVTVVDAALGGRPWGQVGPYVAAQVVGGACGVVVANLLFEVPAVAFGTTQRAGGALVASEALATAGLVLVIFGMVRAGSGARVPAAVGAYIGAAIFFTPSAAFANPAVAVARQLTDTWTGIRPVDVPGYVAGQAVGALAALLLVRWLFVPESGAGAADALVPHDVPADDPVLTPEKTVP